MKYQTLMKNLQPFQTHQGRVVRVQEVTSQGMSIGPELLMQYVGGEEWVPVPLITLTEEPNNHE